MQRVYVERVEVLGRSVVDPALWRPITSVWPPGLMGAKWEWEGVRRRAQEEGAKLWAWESGQRQAIMGWHVESLER